jgi:FixJ family two-component response regulator
MVQEREREHGAGMVYVVDDDPSICEALSGLLRAVGWQAQTFASAAAFLEAQRPDSPACLLLDVRLPGVSGVELQRTLAERGDTLPIVFMTGHGDIPMGVHAIKAGAVEFLPKPFREDELLDAIDTALARSAVDRRARLEMEALRKRVDSLSSREREVMLLVVKGLLNKQSAARMAISEVTVKVHRRRVMEKMGAQSLPELVRMVERVLPISGLPSG